MTEHASAPSGARRPRGTTAERREEIVRAAMRTFGARGYHAGSLAEVAERVGMTHAGVLHHFGSKDRLLQEVLRLRDRIDVESLEAQHIPGGLDLFRHLERTARANAERHGIVQAYTVITAESVTDGHPAGPWARDRFEVLRREITQALHTVVVERGGPADDPALSDEALSRAASAIIAAMDGLQIQWLLDPDAVDLAAATAFAIEGILAAALAGSSREAPLDDDRTGPSPVA